MPGFSVFMFGLGLVLLVWGSSLFVDSAVGLANRLHLPEVLVGATVVSLGTTLPEVLFSTRAALGGMPDMALGNALGSVLCNTGFIAGFLILLSPVRLGNRERKNVSAAAVFLGFALFVYFISGIRYRGLTRTAGFCLLAVCILYVVYHGKRNGAAAQDGRTGAFGVSDAVRFVLEAVAVYLGAGLLVEYGPQLARAIGVPDVIISLTFVALGTSLPEFVTSLVSLRKKHSSLSLGNILGANALDLLLVGGIASSVCPSVYPEGIMQLELPCVFLLLSVLCVPCLVGKRAGRLQGAALLGIYALYLLERMGAY